uniref:RHG32 protein n=2 Tax=Naja naja TaxID=35670 RepID=A0A8C7DX47_NAJNA
QMVIVQKKGSSLSSRMMKSSLHAEEDDFLPELQRSIHPRERPDWEETLNAMARGADIPEISGELSLRTCGSTASMKVKNVKKLSFTKGHFPKMAECAHFHYENVDFGNIQVRMLNRVELFRALSWRCFVFSTYFLNLT